MLHSQTVQQRAVHQMHSTDFLREVTTEMYVIVPVQVESVVTPEHARDLVLDQPAVRAVIAENYMKETGKMDTPPPATITVIAVCCKSSNKLQQLL